MQQLKTITEKSFYVLIPALFTFPFFKESISTFFFILLTTNSILYLIATRNFKIRDKKIFIYTIPFWIILIDCLIRYQTNQSIKPARHALYFMLFPLVFGFLPLANFLQSRIRIYFELLKYTCIAIAVGYIGAFFYYYDFQDLFWFHYGIPKFRTFVYLEIPFFKIHPTYYTSIVFLCTAYSFDRVVRERKYLELIPVAVFILITFMLLAKLNIVLMMGLLFGMLLFRSNLSRTKRLVAVFVLFAASASLVVTVPGIKNRFNEIFTSYNKPPVGVAYDSTNVRMAIYKCCTDLAGDNLLTGVGFTNIGGELHRCYEENYNSNFYRQQGYLSHNYYFYILISSGMIGFAFYLYFLFRVARKAIEIHKFLLYVGLANIFIMCISEDYFYRQYGLFFFCLLFFTFYNHHQAKKTLATDPLRNQPLS